MDPTMPSESSPLVSIVTPTLNQARFIGDAIGSIKGQTYQNLEHIVIDGGSTDTTIDRLRAEDGTYRLQWRSEPDRGMYDAINKGLAMAEGEIFGYLNSDDVLTPWAVETVMRTFDAHPEADVVFGDALTIDESTGKQRLALVPPFDVRAYALIGSLAQPAVFWRRRAFERVGGFDAELRFVGDLDLWLRLGGTARFVRVDEVLAIERHHDGALSRASAVPMAAEAAQVRARYAGGGTLLARSRAALWRRVLWLRFLRSIRASLHRPGSPWSKFIANGQIRLSPMRVSATFIPRVGGRFAWDAIASDRAWFGPQDEGRSATA